MNEQRPPRSDEERVLEGELITRDEQGSHHTRWQAYQRTVDVSQLGWRQKLRLYGRLALLGTAGIAVAVALVMGAVLFGAIALAAGVIGWLALRLLGGRRVG